MAHMLETYLKIKLSASTERNTTSKEIYLKRNIPQVNSLQKRSSQSVTLFLGPLQESLIHGGDIHFNLMEHLSCDMQLQFLESLLLAA